VEELVFRAGRRDEDRDKGGRVGHGDVCISLRGRLDELVFVGVGVGSCLVGIVDSSLDGGGGGGVSGTAGKAIPSSERGSKSDARWARSLYRTVVPDRASWGVLTTIAPLPRGPLRFGLKISKELSNLGSDMRIGFGAAVTFCEVFEEELV